MPESVAVVAEHADDAGRALVARGLDVEAVDRGLVVGRGRDGDGPGVRHVGQQGADGQHGRHAESLGQLDQLEREGAPAHGRLDALHEHDVAVEAGLGRDEDAGRRPRQHAAALVEHDAGPVDLEVVVLLGVEGGDDLGVPDVRQVAHRARGGLARVVPALEGSDEHGLGQLRDVLELQHAASFTVVADRLPIGSQVNPPPQPMGSRRPHVRSGRPRRSRRWAGVTPAPTAASSRYAVRPGRLTADHGMTKARRPHASCGGVRRIGRVRHTRQLSPPAAPAR